VQSGTLHYGPMNIHQLFKLNVYARARTHTHYDINKNELNI